MILQGRAARNSTTNGTTSVEAVAVEDADHLAGLSLGERNADVPAALRQFFERPYRRIDSPVSGTSRDPWGRPGL